MTRRLCGVPDGPGLRVDITNEELSEAVNADTADVVACLERLEQAKLVHRDVDSLVIAEVGKLDQFLEFLDMKEKFGEKR